MVPDCGMDQLSTAVPGIVVYVNSSTYYNLTSINMLSTICKPVAECHVDLVLRPLFKMMKMTSDKYKMVFHTTIILLDHHNQ